ncbi:20436_t:CDS:2, partial [Racocetra persica]
ANINTANVAGKQRALKLFQSCLTGEASRWVEDKLIDKKWRLNHVRCRNALANMAAVVALNNANIMATMINAPDTSSSGQKNITKADLQAVAKSLQETMSRVTKTLDNSKKSADKRVENTAIICFLSDLLRKKLYIHLADENNHDPVDDISDSLAGLTLNS